MQPQGAGTLVHHPRKNLHVVSNNDKKIEAKYIEI
jgi:hypothetical protein